MNSPRFLPRSFHRDTLPHRLPTHDDLLKGRLIDSCEDIAQYSQRFNPLLHPPNFDCVLLVVEHSRDQIIKTSTVLSVLYRRCRDDFILANCMFKAAYPYVEDQIWLKESEYLLSISSGRAEKIGDNLWLPSSLALSLARQYKIVPWVRALLAPIKRAKMGPHMMTPEKSPANGARLSVLPADGTALPHRSRPTTPTARPVTPGSGTRSPPSPKTKPTGHRSEVVQRPAKPSLEDDILLACAQLLTSITSTRNEMQAFTRAYRSARDSLEDILLQLTSLHDAVSLWQHDCTERYNDGFGTTVTENGSTIRILGRVPRILEHCAELMVNARVVVSSISDGKISTLDQSEVDGISRMLDAYVISLRAVLEAYNL
jgi:hypothetical protein